MHNEFVMGNEAIALGALAAGVNLVCGYPGTPSTEVLETVAKRLEMLPYRAEGILKIMEEGGFLTGRAEKEQS